MTYRRVPQYLRHALKQAVHAVLGREGETSLYAANAAWRAWRADRVKPELGIARYLLRSGETAIDVGANGADWTRALSHAVGDGGIVFAFEADPFYGLVTEMAIRLLRLRNVRFHRYGLSDTEEITQLVVRDESGHRLVGISRVVHGGSPEVMAGRTVPVALRRLDDVLAEQPDLGRTRLVKLDVEGHELPVLRGSVGLLDLARPMLVCEVGHADLQGMAEHELFRWLGRRDYVGFSILLQPLRVRCVRASSDRPMGSAEDILFVPAESVETLPAELLASD